MIKILGISGSPVKQGNVDAVLEEAVSHIQEGGSVETELLSLSHMEIGGCIHCNWCIKNQSEGKYCAQQDDMDVIYPKIREADGIILGTPVHFGRLSGQMANMIDRLRVFVHGNIYKGALRNKIGGALAVAFFRGGGLETTLISINAMFLIFKMIIANSAFYQQGSAAFTSQYGEGRVVKGMRHMAFEDQYGMASAKDLADRMVELARIVKAGEQRVANGSN